MSEVYAGQKPQYASDWTIEQAEANAPTGSEVEIVEGGMLTGCKGVVLSCEMRKAAGSWHAEASVALTDVTHPLLALAPPQKISASRLRLVSSTEVAVDAE
jgi:hypothetical protein